jgi:phenylpropionate dioxygenase-like ring-hydroxylating dioxygenase large terminal subunit
MRSLLAPSYYTSVDVLERERERLFRRLWIFVGPRTLLGDEDSYITRSVGGVPVVVQNQGGKINAYVNRCAHRGSAIQLGDHGHRRLACPYHGWTYDHHGRVASIPFHDLLYGFEGGPSSAPRLTRVAVECVGNLVFVNLDPKPMRLDEQFHRTFLDRIASVSSHFDDEVLISRFDGKFNWKLIFENVLDGNHVPFVHSKTFLSMIPTSSPQPSVKPLRIAAPPPDDALSNDLRDLSYTVETALNVRHWPWHDNVERFTEEARYYNYFLYPNVNFTAIAGVLFPIQQFDPVAPDRTEYTMWLMTGRQKLPNPATPAILWPQARGEKTVIDEDFAVLEALQRGIGAGSLPAYHGQYETQLRSMARVYLDRLA